MAQSYMKIQFLALVCILIGCSYPNLRHIRNLTMTERGPVIRDHGAETEEEEFHKSRSGGIMFDEISHILYNQASRPAETKRQRLDLDQWIAAEGFADFNDTDRKVLGDLFYNSTSLFEYGLGESTAIAGHVGVPRYTGVSSDIQWLEHVRSNTGMDHFRYFFADIGELLEDGNPVKAKLQKNTYDYQLAPLLLEAKPFDTYLINGIGGSRYRVECLCVSFLHAMKYNQDTSKVKFGIYNINARDDERLQEFANVVTQTKKLRVYNIKSNATEDQVFNLWNDSKTQPDLIDALNGTNSTDGPHKRRTNDHQNITKFDMLATILFDKASTPVTSDRNRFDLIAHRQKDTKRLPRRGFNDKDRVVLGHQFHEANSVFQYGLGESTMIATHTGVPRYTAVDSDPNHILYIRNSSNFTMDHFRFSLADTGETGKGGRPNNTTLAKNEFDYQIAPLLLEQKAFDFYFIDGRYRVACACVSFLHAMKYGADMTKVKIGMHVNSHVFRGYEVLKDVADRIEEGDDQWIYIYQLKKGTTQDDLFRLWTNHRHVIS